MKFANTRSIVKKSITLLFILSVVTIIVGNTDLVQSNILSGVLPVAELIVVSTELFLVLSIIIRLYTVFKTTRQTDSLYISDKFETSITQLYGESLFLRVLLSEVLMLYFAIFGRVIRLPSIPSSYQRIGYQKTSKAKIATVIFLLIIAIELPLLHLLLSLWNPTVAWIFTVLGVYSIFWILGDYNAIPHHPIVITDQYLHLRLGLRWKADIPLKNIRNVENYSRSQEITKLAFGLSVNTTIQFHEKQVVKGLFGFEKQTSGIAFPCDTPDLLRYHLRKNVYTHL